MAKKQDKTTLYLMLAGAGGLAIGGAGVYLYVKPRLDRLSELEARLKKLEGGGTNVGYDGGQQGGSNTGVPDGTTEIPGNGDNNGAEPLPEQVIQTSPTLGRWYRIKSGDTLLHVAGEAHGIGSGSERLARAKEINDHPANANVRKPTQSEFNAKYIGPQVISFNPSFAADPSEAQQGIAGNSFAVIFIPVDASSTAIAPPVEPRSAAVAPRQHAFLPVSSITPNTATRIDEALTLLAADLPLEAGGYDPEPGVQAQATAQQGVAWVVMPAFDEFARRKTGHGATPQEEPALYLAWALTVALRYATGHPADPNGDWSVPPLYLVSMRPKLRELAFALGMSPEEVEAIVGE